MFCSGATLCSWDNVNSKARSHHHTAKLQSTRGLDASTALDYAKSLRLLTDIMQQTTFVSLYQAGEGIYQQFDKIIVLDEGHVVYFGPRAEAREYMMGLGYKVFLASFAFGMNSHSRISPVKLPLIICLDAPIQTNANLRMAEMRIRSHPRQRRWKKLI